MRRVMMMEGDVGPGSTPLLDTFGQIARGQSRISIAQVKVRRTAWRAGLTDPLCTGSYVAGWSHRSLVHWIICGGLVSQIPCALDHMLAVAASLKTWCWIRQRSMRMTSGVP